ncbi:MAG TPA: sodium:calcium antiporter [Vicinamibacteria bacterium]
MLPGLLTFAASLVVLLAAARFFTQGAERIGLALGMSPFAVGVLIVSVGTSLPELVASIVAANGGTSQIVLGNVLGANLSNLLLVMGAVAVAARASLQLGEQYILIDLHFLLGSVLLLALALRDGVVGRLEGVALLAAYGVYLLYLVREGRTEGEPTRGGAAEPAPAAAVAWRDVLVLGASAALIYLGARYTISSLETIALGAGVSADLVALTLLSVGTTLPELVVSATAARAGKADVAVGNVLGSCVFNTLAVTGTASLVGPLRTTPDMRGLALPVFGASALLFYLLTLDKRVSRWEGVLLLLVYGFFILEVARLV